MKNNCCLLEKLFKIQKKSVFIFGKSFSILEMMSFLYYVLLAPERYIAKKPNDIHSVVTMETLLAPVSFLTL